MTETPRPSGDHEAYPAHPAPPEYPAYQAAPTGPPPPGDHPAPPAYAPQPPAPGHGAHRARRLRRPVLLVAAAALVSALVSGGTAALVTNATGDSSGSVSTPVVNANSKSSGVSAVAEAVSPSIVEISATSSAGESTGSGVIVTSGGEIVTNNHVVAGADTVKVTFSDGSKKTASVVGTDKDKDLALIKVSGASGLKAASLGDSKNVQVGDEVVAIGSPEGLTGTVTSGIVSALDRDVTVSTDENQGQGRQGQGGGGWPFEFGGGQYNGDVGSSTTTYKAIQTDASLNPGNSGGALINMQGQIIGINSAMYPVGGAGDSSSSAGSVGLGFSIPIDTVKSDLATLRDGGTN